MSLLYAVVFASRCRSNHHRLALDALRHLKASDAERWHDLLLHYHVEYLGGAKAPDEVFKDFKNHVLHVRDGDWGGAVEACEEWYRRTVRALSKKDWAQAAWSAGVMSHYYVDPIQPFHTHQTEEEGVIHRAVEWSFSKSYSTFQKIIETDLGGYPDVAVPKGENWLAQMVKNGALASNPHYETIIEHYDFEKGVKDPPAGLDQELKDVIAKLVAHAAVGLARILDKAFEEAAVRPPKIDGALQAVLLGLEMPIQAVLAKIDDGKARREVAAQYEEFNRTGKVRKTLGEDDKVVRALYAAEVLKTPLSSLDARWPRETGAKTGAGTPARAKAKKKAAPKIAALPKAAAPKPPKREKEPSPRFTLDGAAPVLDAPSIGPKTAKRLELLGVKTVADLLALSPENGQNKLAARHISAQVIRDWQAQALLACTVPGLRSREAQALVACGVRDASELMQFEPAMLTEAIARWGLSEDGARVWGTAPAPTEDDVADWIERAKHAGKAPAAKRSAA
jgi:predicted flap endonuclease-1-like 5' DNA nuclease